ncbi:LPS export ABC transporter periplasmic protein LptC [Bacteroidia bacterium]|nr:LPS export ABC transporter periplasmic protein LptC [Bacteroidia bacterium]
MVLQAKTSVIGIILIGVLMLSCGQRNKSIAVVDVNVSDRPMLHGEGISSLISDSGITRFRLEAEVWDAYSNDSVSYWYFPEGFYAEQFDSLFQVSGYVKADTAYYFEKIGLWKLINNVFIKQLESATTCETSELFWDTKEPATSVRTLYTDKFVKITTPDKVITTEGFKSNRALTHYILYENTLVTEMEEDNSTEK